MNARLSQSTLDRLPPPVRRPGYDPQRLAIGIVHFGPGAFHRAHLAWYVESLLAADPRWGICAVSLRSHDVRDALAPQDGLYTLVTLDRTIVCQVIGAIREVLVAPESPQRVLDRLCAAATRIVTITVTEKGYCLAAGGGLDKRHPDILQDMRTPRAPTSLIGYLVESLCRRRAAGIEPPAIISCDNLADNGARLARAVVELAATRDPALADWIESKVSFPRTMVDSITPATTDALRQHVIELVGVEDRWPVQRESFVQWVMENSPRSDGPDWTKAGVIVTDDVGAYDRAKLRLLNAAHSTLAYVGLLAGFTTVSEAMADPTLSGFIAAMMRDDIRPTLRSPEGLDLEHYIAQILERLQNPAVRHQLAQIAWDGSQKLPVRLFGTIADNLAAKRSIERLCVPIAAWMHFVRLQAARGEQMIDPLAARLLAIGRACRNDAATDIPTFMTLDTVFPASLAADWRFIAALRGAYAEPLPALKTGARDPVLSAQP